MKLYCLKVHMIYGSVRVDCDTRSRPCQLGDLSVIRILYARLAIPKYWLWDTQQDNQPSCSAINIEKMDRFSRIVILLLPVSNSFPLLFWVNWSQNVYLWYINETESVSVFEYVRTTMDKQHNRSLWKLTGNSLRAQNESSRRLMTSPLVPVFFIIFKESTHVFCPNG